MRFRTISNTHKLYSTYSPQKNLPEYWTNLDFTTFNHYYATLRLRLLILKIKFSCMFYALKWSIYSIETHLMKINEYWKCKWRYVALRGATWRYIVQNWCRSFSWENSILMWFFHFKMMYEPKNSAWKIWVTPCGVKMA